MQASFTINSSDTLNVRESLIEYAKQFELACILDSNSHYILPDNISSAKFDIIAGFSFSNDKAKKITDFDSIDNYLALNKSWHLGYLTYDLKNNFEDLQSKNPDYLDWPPMLFFDPDILILLKRHTLTVISNSLLSCAEVFKDLIKLPSPNFNPVHFILTPRISKIEYLEKIFQIKKRIYNGDIYEVNFCHELYTHAKIDPYSYFSLINNLSPSPFASYFKVKDKYLLCLSPERFLKKEGDSILMQPMKGTAPRSIFEKEDLNLKVELLADIKERSENIMIVDLVRNDLSKIAHKNSVRVEELCKIYSFAHVHQMISSIRAKLRTGLFSEIIKATFPMGSMTGAPKIEAMKIIDDYEIIKRGLYSGAVGYISPSFDFDLNVVIRSLQYNAKIDYLSYMVGSAITALSDPAKEYEECLLKAYGIKNAFNKEVYT
jgi:para-aminobenzoate synthetase component I